MSGKKPQMCIGEGGAFLTPSLYAHDVDNTIGFASLRPECSTTTPSVTKGQVLQQEVLHLHKPFEIL